MQVYVGADQLSIETLDAGMDGVIGGGGSSVMAKIFVDIWHLFKEGGQGAGTEAAGQDEPMVRDGIAADAIMAGPVAAPWLDFWMNAALMQYNFRMW